MPELRSTTSYIDVHRISNLHGLQEQCQKHWGLRKIQPYFPSIDKLFKLDNVRVPFHYGLKTRENIQTVSGEDTIYASGNQKKVHKKISMILPPYRVMHGDFGVFGLTQNNYIQSPNNSAYIGSLIAVALSESECSHFPDVYGVFSAITEKFTLNISDDYEDLCDRHWFSKNIGHFFDLKLKTPELPLLTLEDTDERIEVEDIEGIPVEVPIELPTTPTAIEDEDESDECSTRYIFDIHTDSGSSEHYEDGIGFEEQEEDFAFASFKDCPVQVTVMEQCKATLFDLFKENKETEKRSAWLVQVVFALAFAQRTFGFVHNDLHAMNVMYIDTPKEFLYYSLSGKVYRVPTFGKLIKIIDFERSCFSIKLPKMKEAKTFMSSQFDFEEEAGGQYNYGPFYNPKYPEIKPNPSFDLVRLATSMFWDVFPDGPLCDRYKEDPIFQLFMSWMTLPDGTSILFRNLKNKDTHERYTGFTLYKAIAKYCKDTAIPRKQIEKFGGPYVFRGRIPVGDSCLNIDYKSDT